MFALPVPHAAGRFRWRNGVALFPALVAIITCSASVGAATFTVTNLNDGTPPPAGSLRAAVASANATTTEDLITFAAGLTGIIVLTEGPLSISEPVSIMGPGANLLAISGNDASRVMAVMNTHLAISGLRLIDGYADRGSGILTVGFLTATNCEFVDNTATVDGGAVHVFGGMATFTGCTFAGNHANGGGGAVWFGQLEQAFAQVSFSNCTFSGNTATVNGGAIRQFTLPAYTAQLLNCTIHGNAAAGGGGIALAGGQMTLQNTIIAGNSGSGAGPNILKTGGVLISGGHNLLGDNAGSGYVPGEGDQVGTPATPIDANLSPLDYNGGGTRTLLPQSSSPAVDNGGNIGAPTLDQRGLPRVGCSVDSGAVEVQTPPDTDGDGVPDFCDGCPADPAKVAPGICGCGIADADSDGDGVLNCFDNCPDTPACAAVTEQGCPIDSDGDGVPDGCDACPATLAGDPVDANGCSTADEDGDGVLNDLDQCKGTPPCAAGNVDPQGCAFDSDADGLFDGCDVCPGSNDLLDTDGDGIPDCLDPCPSMGDSDGDGLQDCLDGCPADPLKREPGACGCGVVDVDTDGDGVADCHDQCPFDAAKLEPGACGCGEADVDSDSDGAPDCVDQCPSDADKVSPGACGCGNADLDSDGDGTPNCVDQCPDDANKFVAGACGCGIADADSDSDGVPDCVDRCPNDPGKLDPGACGCGQTDADADGNGIPDCLVLPAPPVVPPDPVDPGPPPTDPGPPAGSNTMCGAGLNAGMLAMLMVLLMIRSGAAGQLNGGSRRRNQTLRS